MRFVGQPSDATPRAQMRSAVKRMILARGYQIGDKLPTYRQLADEFGVALLTVQRVMRDLAEEGLIYRLHAKGAFLKQLPRAVGRLSQVALVYPASMTHLVEATYLNEFLAGLVRHCDSSGIDLQVLSLHKSLAKTPAHEVVTRVDGVVLLGVLNERYIKDFVAEGIPLVLADGQTRDIPIHCLAVDNAAAVNHVMDHLYALGHRRVAYLDTRSPDFVAAAGDAELVDSFDNAERRDAYRAAMARLGLSACERIYYAPVDGDVRVEDATRDLLADPEQPTAIVAYDPHQAAALYHHLTARGVRVPGDLSLAAAAGARGEALLANQALALGQADFRRMGYRAVEVLLDQAAGERPARHMIERVGASLLAGTTSAPPRDTARIG